MSNKDIERAMEAIQLEIGVIEDSYGVSPKDDTKEQLEDLQLVESLLMELKEHRRQHGNLD